MIAPILQKLRTKNGFSQRKLAALIGVDQSFVAHIERGQRDPGYDTLQRWLTACKARMIVVDTTETPDGLPPDEARLLTAVRQLDEADRDRVIELAEVLGRVDGVTRELVRSQIDGPVNLLRKSDSSASEIVGERLVG